MEKCTLQQALLLKLIQKQNLQEHSLKFFKILPIYKLISNTGPRHKPLFKVAVKLKILNFLLPKVFLKKMQNKMLQNYV